MLRLSFAGPVWVGVDVRGSVRKSNNSETTYCWSVDRRRFNWAPDGRCAEFKALIPPRHLCARRIEFGVAGAFEAGTHSIKNIGAVMFNA